MKALLSPAIIFYRLALQISKVHQYSDCSTSSMTSEDPALQDVDNAKLGKPLSGYTPPDILLLLFRGAYIVKYCSGCLLSYVFRYLANCIP